MPLTLVLLTLVVTLGWACSPPQGWVPKTMEELLPQYDLVVLGTLMDADAFPFPVKDAEKTYEVFCVLSGDGQPIQREITIKDPPNPCIRVPKTIGQSFILGLSRINDTTFSWWKDGGIEAVLFDFTKENMDSAVKICKLQDPQPPFSPQPIPVVGNRTCPEIPESYKDLCTPARSVPVDKNDTCIFEGKDICSSASSFHRELLTLAVLFLASVFATRT